MSRLIRPCPKCPGYYYEGEACRCCAAIAQARREAESEALEVLRDLSAWVGHAKYSQPLKDYTADEWADCIREQVDVRWAWSRREEAYMALSRAAEMVRGLPCTMTLPGSIDLCDLIADRLEALMEVEP